MSFIAPAAASISHIRVLTIRDSRGIANGNTETLQQLIDKIRTRHPQAQRILLFLDNARYNPARLAQEHLNDGIV